MRLKSMILRAVFLKKAKTKCRLPNFLNTRRSMNRLVRCSDRSSQALIFISRRFISVSYTETSLKRWRDSASTEATLMTSQPTKKLSSRSKLLV